MAKPKELPIRRLTPQKVRAVLRKAGLTAAKYHPSGRVRGWGSYSPGYKVEAREDRPIKVWYIFGVWSDRSDEDYDREHARIAAALTAAGIAAEVRDGFVWVPVDQDAQPEESR